MLHKARGDALRGQLADLETELREYEALRAGQFEFDQLKTITELPVALIKARIARGLSQRDLADRLGIKEQQIQRYEASEYGSASLARIRDVISALGVDVDETLLAGQESTPLSVLINRVSAVGLPPNFVRKRLVPRRLWPSGRGSEEPAETSLVSAAVETIGKIFQWSPGELLGTAATLNLNPPRAVRGSRWPSTPVKIGSALTPSTLTTCLSSRYKRVHITPSNQCRRTRTILSLQSRSILSPPLCKPQSTTSGTWGYQCCP